MKENYQIYLPYQFHLRAHSVDREPKLPNKKMKTMFLSNMSKSRRLTSTFFPTNGEDMVPVKWRGCRTSLFCTIKLGKNVVFSSGNFMVVPIICITLITIDSQPLKQTFNMYFAKGNTQNEEKSILPHDNSLEVFHFTI